MKARALVGILLIAGALPGPALGGDLVMNYAPGWSLQTQTLDGVVQERLPVPMQPLRPSPLPDGGAVFSNAYDSPGIWLLQPNGTLRRVTTDAYDADASATRDGTRVTFDRYDPISDTKDVYIVNADGTGLQKLTDGAGKADYLEPVFSPDGGTIAYLCSAKAAQWGRNCGPQADGGTWYHGVLLMNADGTSKRMIFRGESSDPTWSNDGQWLASIVTINVKLSGDVWTGYPELYVVKTDGSDLFADDRRERFIPTSTDPADTIPVQPSFSSDDQRLVFWASFVHENTQAAFVVNRDGSGLKQLSLDGFPYPTFVPPPTGGGPPATVDATHVVVPTVALLTPQAARARMSARHLRVTAVVKKFSKVRRGRVMGVWPKAGTKVHRPSEAQPSVTLYVSKGRKQKVHRHRR